VLQLGGAVSSRWGGEGWRWSRGKAVNANRHFAIRPTKETVGGDWDSLGTRMYRSSGGLSIDQPPCFRQGGSRRRLINRSKRDQEADGDGLTTAESVSGTYRAFQTLFARLEIHQTYRETPFSPIRRFYLQTLPASNPSNLGTKSPPSFVCLTP